MATNPPGGRKAFILRDPAPGDLGWAVSRQAVFYTETFGWDNGFEQLLLEIAGAFLRDFNPARERAWIAERDGRNVGCIFLVDHGDDVAQLRMLYVEPDTQGLGIGRALIEACLAQARAGGYRRMVLWTNAELPAARHLYEGAGFRLQSEDRGTKFGKDFHGQEWALDF